MTRVQVFSKWPTPGQVNTRLTKRISPELAAELQWAYLIHTCKLAYAFDAQAELWLSEIKDQSMLERLEVRKVFTQQGKDLGERMAYAADTALAEGCSSLIIGTDCPYLDKAYLQKASDRLDCSDVVLGPAQDGGYVLIGLRTQIPAIFSGIPWGTEKVLAMTLDKLAAGAFQYSLLEPLSDIDRPEDLAAFLKTATAKGMLKPKLYRELIGFLR